MSRSVLSRLDLAARYAAPGLATLALAFASVTPLHIPFYGPVAPILLLGPVYYWRLNRPDLMPYGLLFAVGLLYGFLVGAPLGLHALALLLCGWLVAGQRRLLQGRPFILLWWGFLMLALTEGLIEWLGYSILFGRPLAVGPAVLRALLTAALFPLLDWLMVQLHRRVLRRF